MKKIINCFLAIWIVILLALTSCGPTVKKTIKTPSTSDKELVTWNAKLQDSLKYTIDQVNSLTFYNGSTIHMSGSFFSISSFVENGVAIMVDTSEEHSRMIDPMTEGHITGTPQRDPGKWPIKSMHITYVKKNGMSFEFEYYLDGNGNTVLKKDATVTYEGKKYAISVYNIDQNGYVQSTNDKLMLYLRHRHVVIKDDQ